MDEDESEASIDWFETIRDRSATGSPERDDRTREITETDSDPHATGTVISGKRLPVATVPAGYPITMSSDEVLVLDVRLDSGEQTTVYTDWSGTVTDTVSLGDWVTSLVDLYGEEVPLDRTDDHYVLATPSDSTEVSPKWVYGVVVGLVGQVVFWGLDVSTLTSLIFLGTWLSLPVVTYLDVKYVRTTSDWAPNRIFWPIIVFVWLINIPAILLYLYRRSRAH